MKKIVYLQGIGDVEQRILIKLKKDLEWVLRDFITSIEISQNSIPLYDSEYDRIRRQYDAGKILSRLNKIFKKSNLISILGIIDEDVYSRFLNFVFGIAEKKYMNIPGACLISVTRLREEFYRRPENKALFELRVLKEALHELGHTFELNHCENECVMRFSNCLADTDRKPPYLCNSCLALMENFFKKIR